MINNNKASEDQRRSSKFESTNTMEVKLHNCDMITSSGWCLCVCVCG